MIGLELDGLGPSNGGAAPPPGPPKAVTLNERAIINAIIRDRNLFFISGFLLGYEIAFYYKSHF